MRQGGSIILLILICSLQHGLEVHVKKTKLDNLLLADNIIVLGEWGFEWASALSYENVWLMGFQKDLKEMKNANLSKREGLTFTESVLITIPTCYLPS